MALRFVTAKTGSAHISSADWRSLNRGIVGRGNYILIDTENNNPGGFIASPSRGEISIPPCSLMWSGAHIRNTTTTVLKYTPPTIESTINVWLHYLKDADIGVESLDFVVTVNDQPSPIIDEIEDNTLEAYTLFCYFTHKVELTEEVSYSRAFKPITTSVRTQEKLDEQWSEFNGRINKEIEDRQSDISTHSTRLSNLDEDVNGIKSKVMERVKVLYESNGTTGLSDEITVNERVTNYSLLCFEIRRKDLVGNMRGDIFVTVPITFDRLNKYVNVVYQNVEKGTVSTNVTNYSGRITIDATVTSKFKISVSGDLREETLRITGVK